MSELSFKRASILVISLILFKTTSAYGQVIPDNTIDSRVTRQGNTFLIENGAVRGGNLFHSFQNFSVQTGGTAHFNNAANIQNIFSRVTGTSASNIDGTVRANGSANLFLLNPNGILFSQNASLDIGGSFLATTAHSIRFVDGVQFSAISPETPPLLTVAAPIGIQLGNNPGTISLTNTGHQLTSSIFSPVIENDTPPGLQVLPGNTLALVGGDVTLNGGTVFAPGGRIEVGSVKQGHVTVDTTNSQWSFRYLPENTFGNIELSNESLLDVSGPGGAALEIHGRQIIIKEDSAVLIQNRGAIPDKGLVVKATDLIEVTNLNAVEEFRTRISSESLNSGASAPITLLSPKIIVRDGGLVTSRSFSSAKGGNISIEAPSYLRIEGIAPEFTGAVSLLSALAFSSGKAGDVTVTTPHLNIRNGGRLSSSTFGQGDGGKVRVVADLVEVTGFEPQLLQSSNLTSESFGTGNAGSLVIDTSKLILANGGRVNTSLASSGNGGNLVINANDYIEIRGNPGPNTASSLSADAVQIPPPLRQILNLPPLPSGDSGSITINTPRLSLTNGGQISVLNEGTGDAGDLKVFANYISLDKNSLITATTQGGKGGNITLNFGLTLIRDSSLTASATKKGQGGNISASGDVFVALGESSLTAEAEKGQGGNITIAAKAVLLGPDVDVSVSSDAGLQASGTFRVVVEEQDFGETTAPAPDVVSAPKIISVCNPSTQPSRFVVKGPGGLKVQTRSIGLSSLVWQEKIATTQITAQNDQVPMDAPKSLSMVEAEGWQKIDDGRVKLIGPPPGKKTHLTAANPACSTPSS